jgi:hypothetical protein
MNYKKVVKQIISEIIHDQMKPTMKYYAFDWDDNLMYMPTKIYTKDDKGKVVGMSTEDFAEYRTEIGKEPFDYEGHTIVGFDENPFRDFNVPGDEGFSSPDRKRYHPVSFGQGSAANPEQLKVDAMKEFMTYVQNLSRQLQEKAFMKNKISNYFVPYIGFSDDDLRNVQAMKKHFDDESGLEIYHTGGGKKTKY